MAAPQQLFWLDCVMLSRKLPHLAPPLIVLAAAGMGCSAGVIAIGLAKKLLAVSCAASRPELRVSAHAELA